MVDEHRRRRVEEEGRPAPSKVVLVLSTNSHPAQQDALRHFTKGANANANANANDRSDEGIFDEVFAQVRGVSGWGQLRRGLLWAGTTYSAYDP